MLGNIICDQCYKILWDSEKGNDSVDFITVGSRTDMRHEILIPSDYEFCSWECVKKWAEKQIIRSGEDDF